MARISLQTRHVLRTKVNEAAEAKRKVIADECAALDEKIDKRIDESKVKALKEINKELVRLESTVDGILAKHGLKFSRRYTYNQHGVYNLPGHTNEDGRTVLESSAKSHLACDAKDKDVVRRDELKKKLEDIDKAIDRACNDIEFRISLGAKFNEVVELIDNLKF